jgi:hypothetical protein
MLVQLKINKLIRQLDKLDRQIDKAIAKGKDPFKLQQKQWVLSNKLDGLAAKQHNSQRY